MADEARGDDTPSGIDSENAPRTSDLGGSTAPGTDERWWGSILRLARWVLGALTLVVGLTWILLNLHGPSAVLDTAIGCVLAAGGLVLLMPHRIQLPRLTTTVAVVVVGVGGTAAGLLSKTAQSCCQFAYIVDRGWPFHWAQRGAVADDSATAFRLAQDADWRVDLVSFSADLLLWAYVGMLLVAIFVLVRGNRRGRREPHA